MALTKRHEGFGRWSVYEDGVKVAGPMTKDQAEARILAPPAPQQDRGAAYLARMAADLNKPFQEEFAEIRALLAKRHDEDETNIIMRQIEPIIKSGKQAGRRERRSFVIPAKAA